MLAKEGVFQVQIIQRHDAISAGWGRITTAEADLQRQISGRKNFVDGLRGQLPCEVFDGQKIKL